MLNLNYNNGVDICMARIPVSFAYGPKDLLPSTHRTGTFYAVTDEGEQRLYVDLPDGMRLPMGITESDVSDMLSGYVREYQLDRKMDKFGTYEDNPDGWGTLLTLTQDTLISSPYGDSGMYLGGSEDVAYFRKGEGMLELDGADESTLSQNGTYLGVQGQSYSNPAVEIRGRNKSVRLLVNGKEMSTKEYVDTSVYSVQSKINALSSLGLTRKMVEELPHNYLAEPNTIYMIPAERSEQDNGYDEYLVVTYDLMDTGMNWGFNCSSFVNLTGTNIRSSVRVEYAIPTYMSVATGEGESYIITLVSPEDKSIGYTITIPYNEVDASLDMVFSDIENCLRITDTWSRWVLTLAFDGTTALSLIAYANDKSLELIGTTLVDLESKMDKFGTYSNNILAINSGVKDIYDQSRFRIADINNIGMDISTQSSSNVSNYVRLEYAGPGGSFSGLDVRVLDTPIADGSAVSKSYVQQHISTLNTKVNSLISTAVKRVVCDGGLPLAYLEAEHNTIYMLYNDLRETVGDNVGVNTYDEYIFTDADPQIHHYISSDENIDIPIILDPTPLDISRCVVNGLVQHEGSIQVIFTTTGLSYEPAGVDYVVMFSDSVDNPAIPPIINSYESDMGEVWDVIIEDDGYIQITSYENSAFFELIGTTKCDLTGKQDKFADITIHEQYNMADLCFHINTDRKLYGSTICLVDQCRIGLIIETDLVDGTEDQYGVTLHADGPGGQGLNVVVESTPRTDNSATSKAYVDTQLSTLRQEYEQLQQTVQELSEQLALKYLENNTQS